MLSSQIIIEWELHRPLVNYEPTNPGQNNPSCVVLSPPVGECARSAPSLLNAAILLLDLEGRITAWNPEAERLYGWSQPEVLGQNVDSLLQTTFEQPWQEIQEQLWNSGRWEGVVVQSRRDSLEEASLARWQEDRYATPSQSTSLAASRRVTVSSHWSLQWSHTGQPCAIWIVNRQCPEQTHRRSQESAEEVSGSGGSMSECPDSENSKAEILSPRAIYRSTGDARERTLEFVSAAIYEISGYRASDLTHNRIRSYASLIYSKDSSKVAQAIRQAVANQVPFALDYRLLDAGGRVQWVREQGRGIFGASGELLWIDGVIFDMTKRKESEAELQKSQRELNSDLKMETGSNPRPSYHLNPNSIVNILESITDAFFTLDRDWRFTYFNARAEEILFRRRGELMGGNIWDEFPELVDSNLASQFKTAVLERVTVHFEAFAPHIGVWLEVRAYPYQEGLSVYFQDVTSRKQAEEVLIERSRLSAFSAEMGLTLGHGGSLPDILKHCMDALVQHLDVAGSAVWILNPSANLLELRANAGMSLDRETFPERVPWGKSLIGSIAENRQAYSGSLSAVSGKPEELFCDSCSLKANFAAYPLIVEERLVGVLALFSHHHLTDAVQSVLGWVANGIAVVIDRSWAREALLSRREGLLFRLASQIRNSLDLDTILETAVHEIRSLLHIDRCHFLWYLPPHMQPSLTVTHESRSPELSSLLCEYPPQKSVPLAEKIRNLEPLLIDNIATATDIDENTRSLIADMGITSQLLLPLQTRSGQMGAVVCSHCSGSRPWIDSEVELLQAVVDQLALAIDQAELYAQTHAAALAAQTQAQQLSEALQNLKQTQSQLIQTEKMSSLGQMVAGIAHEINNPVNFITGNLVHANKYIQDLLDVIHLYQKHYSEPVPEIQEEAEQIDLEFLAEDLPKILASMQMGADRIRQIVLSLRNFSRLDEAEMKPVDIHEGIDNTLLILHSRWKPNGKDPGVEIVKEYGELPRIECYAGQLNQVFMNILSNAIDALENQPAPHILTIGTAVVSDLMGHPSQVVIRIRDNGPGMSDDVKKRLFDPFFTTKPVGKGTGLGLSISYKIVVDKHGGFLKCESQPGQGAEFWIQIPVKQPETGSQCA